MTSPCKRADLESKMRKKYMRMKTVNNHESMKLNRTVQTLNKTAIYTLEQHSQKTKEMSDLWNKCSTTTGWFDDAVKPAKRDLNSRMMTDFKVMSKPWAYFTKSTIDMWENQPSANGRKQRPKTALGIYSSDPSQKHTNNTNLNETPASTKRPYTASHLQQKSSTMSPQVLSNNDVEAMSHGRVLPQRAKSARIHFNAIQFNSIRLDDKHIKPNKKKQRPVTAGATLQAGDSGSQKNSKYVEQERKMASTVHRKGYERSLSIEADDVFEEDKVYSGNKAHKKTFKTDTTNTATGAVHTDNETPARPMSVSFRRRESTIMTSLSLPLDRHESTSSSKKDMKSDHFTKTYDDTDDEEIENTEKKKKKKSKKELPTWNIPKFYVKPQDRYKIEDMFLMKRYTMLQRQLASEMPPEMIRSPQSLDITLAFSSAQRKKELQHLMEKNSDEQKKDSSKHGGPKDVLKNKIDNFLDKIDDFVAKSKDENDE